MSYRIEYDGRIGKYEVRKENERRNAMYVYVAGAGILAAAILLWPEVGTALRSWIIPGDDAVTTQAFLNMTQDMRSGASLGEAVFGFCRYVIHGA